MRIGARIQDDPVIDPARGMQLVDQHAFVVGLHKIGFDTQRLCLGVAHTLYVMQGHGAVNLWLAGAKQVEVGAVQDQDGMCHGAALAPFNPWTKQKSMA